MQIRYRYFWKLELRSFTVRKHFAHVQVIHVGFPRAAGGLRGQAPGAQGRVVGRGAGGPRVAHQYAQTQHTAKTDQARTRACAPLN